MVEADLAALAAPPPALDPEHVRAMLRSYEADLRALLEGHVSEARQMLRKLLDGTTLMLAPVVVNGERRYAFNGSGNYLRLLPRDLARTVGRRSRLPATRPRYLRSVLFVAKSSAG